MIQVQTPSLRKLIYAAHCSCYSHGNFLGHVGLRALHLYITLPTIKNKESPLIDVGSSVVIARDVRFDDRDRNFMDIYVPQSAAGHFDQNSSETWSKVPVVLFCHGGGYRCLSQEI